MDQIARDWVIEAEYDRVWIGPICGAAERELNIRGRDQGVLRVVAAMMARGCQAGDLASSVGRARFVPWKDQSRSGVLERISGMWDAEKWRGIGRCPDPGETGWLSKEGR